MKIKSDIGMRNLCAGIIEQSIRDWRTLCKIVAEDREIESGRHSTKYWNRVHNIDVIGMSFAEIENFLLNDADQYTDMDTRHILNVLKGERVKAERKRDRLRRRNGLCER